MAAGVDVADPDFHLVTLENPFGNFYVFFSWEIVLFVEFGVTQCYVPIVQYVMIACIVMDVAVA